MLPRCNNVSRMYGARTRARTEDLRFTKPLLYQLSYSGVYYIYNLPIISELKRVLISNNVIQY